MPQVAILFIYLFNISKILFYIDLYNYKEYSIITNYYLTFIFSLNMQIYKQSSQSKHIFNYINYYLIKNISKSLLKIYSYNTNTKFLIEVLKIFEHFYMTHIWVGKIFENSYTHTEF
jgi:hypothetical protein